MTIINRFLTPASRRRNRPAPTSDIRYESVAEVEIPLRRVRPIHVNIERQWLVAVLMSVLTLAMLAGLYLDVTARTAITGREIQSLEALITVNQRVNADLQTQIALLVSYQTLELRAQAMGYRPIRRDEVEYVFVPGYFPPNAANLVTPSDNYNFLAESPQFRQTLLQWMSEQLHAASTPLVQVQP